MIIYKQMVNILNDVDHISKDKTAQGYKFRGIDDMYNMLHGLFAKHGVFISSEVVNGLREERKSKSGGTLLYSIIDVKFTFWAEDGSSVSSTMRGEAMDTSDKASNKAMSAALKYALIQAFLIPTEEQIDTENNNHEPEPKDETIKPKGDIDEIVKHIKAAKNKEELRLTHSDIQELSWTKEEVDSIKYYIAEQVDSFDDDSHLVGSADRVAEMVKGEVVK